MKTFLFKAILVCMCPTFFGFTSLNAQSFVSDDEAITILELEILDQVADYDIYGNPIYHSRLKAHFMMRIKGLLQDDSTISNAIEAMKVKFSEAYPAYLERIEYLENEVIQMLST